MGNSRDGGGRPVSISPVKCMRFSRTRLTDIVRRSMRLAPVDRSGQAMDAQPPVPGVFVPGDPVPSGPVVLDAGEDRHPFADLI